MHIGIFGGAFDPIHYGHLRMAIELSYFGQLDCLFFVPTGTAVHRNAAVADAKIRCTMIQQAITAYSNFHLSEYEIKKNTPSYMCDTLRYFEDTYPNARFSLLMGTDQLLAFHRWKHWKSLLERAELLVAQRPSFNVHATELLPELSAYLQSGRIHLYPITALHISSSAIRAAIHKGEPIDFLLPPEVHTYITGQGLYYPCLQEDYER